MRYIVGLDEVGRGPLAGPVVVAAALIMQNVKIKDKKLGIPRDSKKLTPKQREDWVRYFENNPKIFYAVAQVSPRVIDKINISAAANLAAWRAYGRLIKKSKIHPSSNYERASKIKNVGVFLDGGLYLKKKGFYPGAKTIIKGDQKIPAISIASIIAKVYRDDLMNKMAKKHPGYGFEIHKGYGTKAHYSALRKLGPSEIHRLTFLGKKHKITKS